MFKLPSYIPRGLPYIGRPQKLDYKSYKPNQGPKDKRKHKRRWKYKVWQWQFLHNS